MRYIQGDSAFGGVGLHYLGRNLSEPTELHLAIGFLVCRVLAIAGGVCPGLCDAGTWTLRGPNGDIGGI